MDFDISTIPDDEIIKLFNENDNVKFDNSNLWNKFLFDGKTVIPYQMVVNVDNLNRIYTVFKNKEKYLK